MVYNVLGAYELSKKSGINIKDIQKRLVVTIEGYLYEITDLTDDCGVFLERIH